MQFRVILILLFLSLWAVISAQEVPREQIQARVVNQRYEISFKVPVDDTPGGFLIRENSCYDVFIFARAAGSDEWFNLRALVGNYLGVNDGSEQYVLWEPVLDYRKMAKYDFRVLAVNRKYLPENYIYSQTEQVGLLNAWSDYANARYQISGQPASFRVPIALPAGEYEVKLFDGNTLKNTLTANITHFTLIELPMNPLQGWLTLSAKDLTGVNYTVLGKNYSSVDKLLLPAGSYEVQATWPSFIGNRDSLVTLQVEDGKTTTHQFDFPRGYLTLSSDQPGTTYRLNGRGFAAGENFPLPPGVYTVNASFAGENELLARYILEEKITLSQGEQIRRELKFPIGRMTLTSNESRINYLINGVSFGTVKDLRLPPGQYTVTALLPDPQTIQPYLVQSVRLEVTADQLTREDFPVRYSRLTITSNLKNVSYRIDSREYTEVKDLKLIAGSHTIKAQPPLPYLEIVEEVELAPDVFTPLKYKFKKDKQLLAQERRREFGLHFYSMPLGVIEANQYFNLEKEGGDYSYDLSSKAFSVTGFQLRAINIAENEARRPYSVNYPKFHYGMGALDKIIYAKEDSDGRDNFIIDWFMLNAGFTHLSRGGRFYGQFDLAGMFSSQQPLTKEIGSSMYVSDFDVDKDKKEHSTSIWDLQFGAEARYQLGFRLTKMIYLNLRFGARYQEKMSGGWYDKSEVANWLDNYNAQTPNEVSGSGFPERNASLENLSFFVGFGLDNGLFHEFGSLFAD